MNNKMDTELELENKVIEKLIGLGYKRVNIRTLDDVKENIKISLEELNEYKFSDAEFKRLYEKLDSGKIFNRAKKIRSFEQIELDDGTQKEVYFMHKTDWCKNKFEVANQVKVKNLADNKKNRYDVTIFINGIPMVQIELKKASVSTKEAVSQIDRYKRETFKNTIFDSIQLFIVSNEDDTRFMANNEYLKKQFLFSWADENNKLIRNIYKFCDTFLQPCQLGKYIKHYMILSNDSSESTIMAMRSYQYFAVDKILKTVDNKVKNGYIWHTTGSGKTMTSFKACEMISNRSDVDKVFFVVDRQDLDTQTVNEYKKFENSVNKTIGKVDSAAKLKKEIADSSKKIIITTIQKLERAVNESNGNIVKDLNVVLIFDECHRSQLGEMHQKIDKAFNHPTKFGFTGTPILAENIKSKEGNLNTTEDVFGKALHKYLIHNAIEDKNVLGFYVDTKSVIKEKSVIDDKLVKNIDTKEATSSPRYIKKVADDIINTYSVFTSDGKYNAMLATDGIDKAIKYFKYFTNQEISEDGETVKVENPTKLKVACVFSVNDNEDQKEVDFSTNREELEKIIKIYNNTYNENGRPLNYDISRVNDYKRDVAKRVKNRQIDLLIVSDMFLTGFDAKKLNTLYFDKEQKYHNLIQAVSRTNRIDDTSKTAGNIVLYRPNVAQYLDDALKLFADSNAVTNILKKPYNEQIDQLNSVLRRLKNKYENVENVRDLKGENEKLEYVNLMKEVNSLYEKCKQYREFSYDQLEAFGQNDIKRFQTAYFDIYQESIRQQAQNQKETILDSIDFEIELVKRSKVDFDYITQLIVNSLDGKAGNELNRAKTKLIKKVNQDPRLESKARFIEKFLEKYYVPDVLLEDQIYKFNEAEKDNEIREFAQENDFDVEETLKAVKEISGIGDINAKKSIDEIEKIVKSGTTRISLSERREKRNEIKTFIQSILEEEYI